MTDTDRQLGRGGEQGDLRRASARGPAAGRPSSAWTRELTGSGPDGRIVECDVDAAALGRRAPDLTEPTAVPTIARDADSERVPMSRMRRVIAARLMRQGGRDRGIRSLCATLSRSSSLAPDIKK